MTKQQPGFWDSVLESHLSPAEIQRLATARVGIAGAGGLGSNCALMLARSGIGALVIADHDVVSLSNLNRQAYWPRHLAQPKVLALKEQLEELRPELCIQTEQMRLTGATACVLFRHCDVVVEAVDDPVTKSELVSALLQAGFQVVSASGMAGWGGDMARRQLGSQCTVVGDFTREVAEGRPPMAPRVLMAAALEADEVLCRLLAPPTGSPAQEKLAQADFFSS